MDNHDKLKNPIIISIVSGVIIFLYLWYTASDDVDDKKKTPKYMRKLKNVNILIPIIISLIIWFVISCYLDDSNKINHDNHYNNHVSTEHLLNDFNIDHSKNYELFKCNNSVKSKYSSPLNDNVSSNNMGQSNLPSSNTKYNLINKNTKLNKVQLPDLFIDINSFPQY